MSKPVQPIRPAATVIVVREASSSYEIFMLKRTSKASFASDMYVFPEGALTRMTTCTNTTPIGSDPPRPRRPKSKP